MTALNKQALRSKARSASAGEWIKESGDGWEAICSAEDQANSNFIIAHFEGPDARANREFSQAANPGTVLALLDENYRLAAERDALRENIGGDNTRAAADIYFQLVEECEIPPGGSLVGYVDDIKERLSNAEKRIAELEARTITVKFEPIPMEELGNRRDGKKHPYMFGAGYNSAVVHCESVLHQACAAAGIGVKGE
ncbi:TPA: ead/Ea22-like family protein [Citrobacter freundii]